MVISEKKVRTFEPKISPSMSNTKKTIRWVASSNFLVFKTSFKLYIYMYTYFECFFLKIYCIFQIILSFFFKCLS